MTLRRAFCSNGFQTAIKNLLTSELREGDLDAFRGRYPEYNITFGESPVAKIENPEEPCCYIEVYQRGDDAMKLVPFSAALSVQGGTALYVLYDLA